MLKLDSHVDTLERMLLEGFDPSERHREGDVDLPRMAEGGVDAACFAAFVPQGPLTEAGVETAWARAVSMLDLLDGLAERASGQAAKAITPEEVRTVVASRRIAFIPALENGYALGLDAERVEVLAKRGVAYITLTYQGPSFLGGAWTDPEVGLTEVGERVVARMNGLGVLPDISHAGRRMTYEVLEASRGPVIASHSSCRALCDHARNLSDDQMRALARKGGVVQLTPVGWFLTGREEATLEDFAAHLRHAADVAGIDHIGIGTDFDGGVKLTDCRDVAGLGALDAALRRVGFSEPDLERIWGANFLRVWELARKA